MIVGSFLVGDGYCDIPTGGKVLGVGNVDNQTCLHVLHANHMLDSERCYVSIVRNAEYVDYDLQYLGSIMHERGGLRSLSHVFVPKWFCQ